jgi:hypothetical protein
MLRILGRRDEPWMLQIVSEFYHSSGCDTFAYHRDNLISSIGVLTARSCSNRVTALRFEPEGR